MRLGYIFFGMARHSMKKTGHTKACAPVNTKASAIQERFAEVPNMICKLAGGMFLHVGKCRQQNLVLLSGLLNKICACSPVCGTQLDHPLVRKGFERDGLIRLIQFSSYYSSIRCASQISNLF